MNRLVTLGEQSVCYDIKGNITNNTAVGTFGYGRLKPYSISVVTPTSNAIPLREQAITYNGMMRPASISENNYDAFLAYNGAGERSRMILQNNGNTQLTRYYIGNKYERDESATIVKERLYIGGDAYSASAVLLKNGSGAWNIYYICRDYLGSITHVTDEAGNLVQELSYSPWGRLRNPDTQAVYAPDNEPELFLGRGYTGHEHLATFGLINMNARLYDPVLGRFLSPDPYVQMPYNSQNFNRYSYALNNPLVYVDENGEFFFIIAGALIGAYIGASLKSHSLNPAKWTSDWWKGALIGASVGALAGGTMGTMWASGATISLGVSGSSFYLPIMTFTPATAGGITTMSIGAGLGLGSGLTYAFSNKEGGSGSSSTYDPSSDPLIESYESFVGERQQNKAFNGADYVSLGLSQVSESFYSERTGTWLGKNGKRYNLDWGGNQYTGGKLKFAKKMNKNFGRIAKLFGLVSIGCSWYDGFEGKNGSTQVIMDTGFGLYSTFGGLYGAWTGIWYNLGKEYGPIHRYYESRHNIKY